MTDRLARIAGSLWFRGLVTVLLLGLVLAQVDVSAARSSLAHARWEWFAAAVALMAASIVVGGVRWYLLLRAAAIGVPRQNAIRAFSLAFLLNSVLPTSVGGDAVRAWVVGRPTGRVVLAATSVVLDKATGLACLFVVAWAALLLDPSSVPHAVTVSLAWTTALFAAATAVAVAAAAGSARLARRLPARVREAAEQAWSALHGWARAPRLVLSVIALGVVYQLMAVLVLVLLAEAIGFDFPLSLAAVTAAVVLVAMLLPISVGGFGVREAGFVVLLGEAGIGATDATLLSLLSVLVIVLASVAVLLPLSARSGPLRAPAARMPEPRG